ncbi:MAG: pentapeptide repeat-containing protein [Verrucomicrobiota bacterium]
MKLSEKTHAGKKYSELKSEKELGREIEDSIWVDSEFSNCQLDGAHIASSIFTNCYFEKTSLYWCHAFRCTFIDCKFVRCDLRGSFDEARFVRCGFVHCEVGENNLGGSTKWENAVAVECVVAGEPLPIVEVKEP